MPSGEERPPGLDALWGGETSWSRLLRKEKPPSLDAALRVQCYRARVRAACSSGAPAPERFVPRRLQTTAGVSMFSRYAPHRDREGAPTGSCVKTGRSLLRGGCIACIETGRALLRYCIETRRALLPGMHRLHRDWAAEIETGRSLLPEETSYETPSFFNKAMDRLSPDAKARRFWKKSKFQRYR